MSVQVTKERMTFIGPAEKTTAYLTPIIAFIFMVVVINLPREKPMSGADTMFFKFGLVFFAGLFFKLLLYTEKTTIDKEAGKYFRFEGIFGIGSNGELPLDVFKKVSLVKGSRKGGRGWVTIIYRLMLFDGKEGEVPVAEFFSEVEAKRYGQALAMFLDLEVEDRTQGKEVAQMGPVSIHPDV